MHISIASGKGGTGKTALALMLAAAQPDVTLVDCDVEEPNCHLFLKPAWQEPKRNVTVMVPRIDEDKCVGCGACAAVCLFNAIAAGIAGGKALLFDELCHGCGGCLVACKHGALSEANKTIGAITLGTSAAIPGVRLVSGALDVGVPSGVPLVRAVKLETPALSGDVIVDCPPGTSCLMVNAIKGSDFCILVTEPTPLGRHDLELAMKVAALLQLPAGVVLNKSDGSLADKSIDDLCRSHALPLLARIPHSLAFARQYAAGAIPDDFRAIAADIWRQLRQERSITP